MTTYTIKMLGTDLIIAAIAKYNEQVKDAYMQILLDAMQTSVDESKAEQYSRGYIALPAATMVGVVSREELYVEGGVYHSKAVFPEFGTVNMAARPFWRPFVWKNYFLMIEKLKEKNMQLWNGVA